MGQQQQQQQQHDQEQTNNQATVILQDVAKALNLNPTNEIDKVLPTVQKLVNVVMEHVPNLEQFVDDVCDIVMNHDGDSCSSKNNCSSYSKKKDSGDVDNVKLELNETNTITKTSNQNQLMMMTTTTMIGYSTDEERGIESEFETEDEGIMNESSSTGQNLQRISKKEGK